MTSTTNTSENKTENQAGVSLDDLMKVVSELGLKFAERAAKHDAEGSFVADNFQEMRDGKLFSARIPVELGGGGAPLRTCVGCFANWPTTTAPRPCHSPCTHIYWGRWSSGSNTT